MLFNASCQRIEMERKYGNFSWLSCPQTLQNVFEPQNAYDCSKKIFHGLSFVMVAILSNDNQRSWFMSISHVCKFDRYILNIKENIIFLPELH